MTERAISFPRQDSTMPLSVLFAPDGTILQRGLCGDQIYTAVAEALSAQYPLRRSTARW